MSTPGDSADNPRIRHAMRAVLLTPAHEVLLMKVEEPRTGFEVWFTPGGGRRGDETPHACLRRELLEETGLCDVDIGPHIWTRRHVFDWDGRWVDQVEDYFLVCVEHFEPRMVDNPSPGEASAFRAFRWWTAAEVAASSANFAPSDLDAFLTQLLAEGPPSAPLDTGI